MFVGFGRASPPEHMLKMLRESEPNAFKRMTKFLEDYDRCSAAQRDQVFVPENEEAIVRLFVGALAVFKKHHDKSKAVAPRDVAQSLRLLDLLRDRSPRALGSRWEAIRTHIEAFLDEALPLDIKQAAFSLLFSILDTSILPELKRSEGSHIEDLFCKSFHWPNSYRLRVEPVHPCEFLPRTNQYTETWDTFSLLFRSFIDMCLDSKTNHEFLWWVYMKEKILVRFPLSVVERVAGTPLACPVPVAECLVHFLYCCLVERKINSILATTRDLEIAVSVFNVVMMSVQSTSPSSTLARNKCIALLEQWVDNPSPQGPKIRPQPFEDDIERWSLLAVRCIVMFFQNWKDVKGFKNEQDLETASKCITVIELVSRLGINSEGWKCLFRSMLEIANFYLGVTDEQRRGEATHPPDKALSCFITDGLFALLLRRVTPPELWEDLCHRDRGISSILHLHTTVDSWTRVLLVVARRLVTHISPLKLSVSVPAYLNDHDFLSLRVGGRQKGLQASPWQHRVDQRSDAPTSSIDQQLQPFFSVGSPWFSPSVWNKSTDCCRAWDRLISLIPPKKKVDRDFSISLQALDSICEWFLEAGVLPSTCMQYVLAWLRAAFEHCDDHIPPSAAGSAPSHIEVSLSVAMRLFMRIVMHPMYPISHEDPLLLPLISTLKKMAFKCESVCVQMEAFQALTQLLHVIPHAISFLVPVALESMLFSKRFLQSLSAGHHNSLCRFLASVVHIPGYVIANVSSELSDIWTNLLSALREMLHDPQDSELYSQLMWCCWLALLDASTSSNNAFGSLFLSELSSAMDRFPHSIDHLHVTLEVIRATAVLIPSFRNFQQHCINQILIKLSQGLSSKISQSPITKSSEQSKMEYARTVHCYIIAIREWLMYCANCVAPEVLDQVYGALISCIFEGTNIYQLLQAAMAVQPTDWSEVDRIIASRNLPDCVRSELSIAAEVCMCSLSNFIPSIPSISLSQVSYEYAASLCRVHPHVSLLLGCSRILTFVEDQSTWGKVWVIVRDTTGIRLWCAQSVIGDTDSDSAASVVSGNSQGGSVIIKKKSVSDSKDPADSEGTTIDLSPTSRDGVVSVNDDEVLGGISLLNDEDFVRPSGKLAHFQSNPHTGRVEMLGHLMDFLNESISPTSVALDGSNTASTRLIHTRSQEHVKLSAHLTSMLKEEQAKATELKNSGSPPFVATCAPPKAEARLWRLQFTRQLLSSFMLASCFVSSPCARVLSPDDEIKAFQNFDCIPSRDNSTVLLAFPPRGMSSDADAFLDSLLVHAVRISDSEFFLSNPDRDIRFIHSSDLPPPPVGRWTSPAHVQFLWHPRDAGPFDPASSVIHPSCHCVVLQPIGANLIRVENVFMPNDGSSSPVMSPKSIVPFLRGSIVNVNIIEPIVLASVAIFMNYGFNSIRSNVFTGPTVPALLKRRFGVIYDVFKSQAANSPQSYFDVIDHIHSQ